MIFKSHKMMNLQIIYLEDERFYMKTLIFIGGASATGKSTFARELQNKLNNSVMYRRVQSFYDIAKEKNISEDMIFEKVTSSEVDDYFLN